jgi:hypothetical protein
MQLSIIRCPDKIRFRPYVKRAAIFYAQQLMTPKMLDNIFVRIKFDPKLDALGYAGVIDYNESNKPREFEIEINPLIGSHDILETLAHEMVHIKQMATGKLQHKTIRGKEVAFWNGKKVKADYLDRPWEQQAWSQEVLLSNKLWNLVFPQKF